MQANMRGLYRFRKSEEGATAVEAAIVISAFMLLVFGLVQFAEIFWTWNTMMLAIEEGGRYAMVYNPTNFTCGPPPSSCPGSPTAACGSNPAITAVTWTLGQCAVAQANTTLATYPSLSVALSCTAGCSGSGTMTLQGTFTFNFVTPHLLPNGPITITQQLTVPLS